MNFLYANLQMNFNWGILLWDNKSRIIVGGQL